MADIRIAPGVRIVDLDSGNEANVSAAGNLAVEVTVALPAGAANIGDVDVLTMPGTAVEDAVAAGGETGVAIIGVRNDAAAAKTSTDGDFGMIALDSAGRVGIADLGGSITIDGSVSITGAVDTELPAAAALADNAANPTTPLIGACLLGFDGTTWDRIYAVADGDAVAAATKGLLAIGTDGTNYQVLKTDAAGELQVDVLTGGGAEAPTTPVTEALTSAALAAGAAATLDTLDIPTKKLWALTASATVPMKIVLSTVANSVATTKNVFFVGAGDPFVFVPPVRLRDFYTVGGATAGIDAFRVVITNLDASEAADVYASFAYADN